MFDAQQRRKDENFEKDPRKKELKYIGGFKKIRTYLYSVPTTHPYTPNSFIPLLLSNWQFKDSQSLKAIQEDKTRTGIALYC